TIVARAKGANLPGDTACGFVVVMSVARRDKLESRGQGHIEFHLIGGGGAGVSDAKVISPFGAGKLATRPAPVDLQLGLSAKDGLRGIGTEPTIRRGY